MRLDPQNLIVTNEPRFLAPFRETFVSGRSRTRRDDDEPERQGVQIHGRSPLRRSWLRRLCAGLWLIRAVMQIDPPGVYHSPTLVFAPATHDRTKRMFGHEG